MDTAKYQKSDPAILLLNEIDILLAQTRLMELYLKQAKATAANENTRIHEQYESALAALREHLASLPTFQEQLQSNAARELEQARGRFESELASLRGALAERDRSALQSQAALVEIERSLRSDIDSLRSELEQSQSALLVRDDALRAAAAQLATLHQQVERERSNAAKAHDEVLQARGELAASREHFEAQLRDKDDECASLRAGAAGQTEQLSNRVNELQWQLAEKQLLAESRTADIERLTTTVSQLNEQLSEKDTNHAQDAARWQHSQAQFSAKIAELTSARDELLRSQTALEAQRDQARGANAGLRGELQEAKNRAGELDALLISHQTAMAGVDADRLRLRSELENLEALHSQTKADGAHELAQVRDALTSELNALRSELQQKTWSLAQQQASVENLAQVHREQMRKLEARLSELQPVSEQQARALDQAHGRADALQRQVDELQAALQQTQAAVAGQTEQIRQEYAARLETANSLLVLKSAEMANSGAVRANVEESLRSELSRLRGELQSRSAALHSREEELSRVRAEMTSLQSRLLQLESVSARTESEAREVGQANSSLERDLAGLRDELQQRSSAAAQQQAAMEDLAARHRSRMEQLEASLSAHQRAGEERHREINQARAQIAVLHGCIEDLLEDHRRRRSSTTDRQNPYSSGPAQPRP